jgi:hypothetical protein
MKEGLRPRNKGPRNSSKNGQLLVPFSASKPHGSLVDRKSPTRSVPIYIWPKIIDMEVPSTGPSTFDKGSLFDIEYKNKKDEVSTTFVIEELPSGFPQTSAWSPMLPYTPPLIRPLEEYVRLTEGRVATVAPYVPLDTISQCQSLDVTPIKAEMEDAEPSMEVFLATAEHSATKEPSKKDKVPRGSPRGFGRSPWPDYGRPTPEQCVEVCRLLTEAHGESVRPEVLVGIIYSPIPSSEHN